MATIPAHFASPSPSFNQHDTDPLLSAPPIRHPSIKSTGLGPPQQFTSQLTGRFKKKSGKRKPAIHYYSIPPPDSRHNPATPSASFRNDSAFLHLRSPCPFRGLVACLSQNSNLPIFPPASSPDTYLYLLYSCAHETTVLLRHSTHRLFPQSLL